MRRFVIIITLMFALFTFINAINAATHEEDAQRMTDNAGTEFVQ